MTVLTVSRFQSCRVVAARGGEKTGEYGLLEEAVQYIDFSSTGVQLHYTQDIKQYTIEEVPPNCIVFEVLAIKFHYNYSLKHVPPKTYFNKNTN